MHSRSHIRRVISILLIIVLLYKIGGGLFLHNWLHTNSQQVSASQHSVVIQDASNCNCAEDFYAPLLDGSVEEIERALPQFAKIAASPVISLPSSFHFYYSLRGPPSSP